MGVCEVVHFFQVKKIKGLTYYALCKSMFSLWLHMGVCELYSDCLASILYSGIDLIDYSSVPLLFLLCLC
jgi:hypothetical protein